MYNGKSPTPKCQHKEHNTQLIQIQAAHLRWANVHYTALLPIYEVPSYLWLLQVMWVYFIFISISLHLLLPLSSISSAPVLRPFSSCPAWKIPPPYPSD